MSNLQKALTEREAAEYIGIGRHALRLWRRQGRGPTFFRCGKRLVRYRVPDLDEWIASRLQKMAGDPPTVMPVQMSA